MTEAALPIPHERLRHETRSPETGRLRGIAERTITGLKSGTEAMSAAFSRLRGRPEVASDQGEFDQLLAESHALTTEIAQRFGVATPREKNTPRRLLRKAGVAARKGLRSAREHAHIATANGNDAQTDGDDGTTDSVNQFVVESLSSRESEIPYRREQIQAFAMRFLHTLNSGTISQREIGAFFAERDIFAEQPRDSVPKRIRSLRGYDDMVALIKHYDNNLDSVPVETIVMTDQETVEPFDDKVLFYIQETEYSPTSRKTLPRPKNDVLQFKGKDDKRPDVYIKSIDDIGIEEVQEGKGAVQRISTKKESFSIRGCDGVIIGGQITPDIPTIDISCNGSFTVLPEASLTPAPPEGRTIISIETNREKDVVLPEKSTLAVSTIKCGNLRLEGGRLLNPHPNVDRVRIECTHVEDSNEQLLDPRLFHIVGDVDYSARQQAIDESVLGTQLGTLKGEGQQLEAMDRSEYVSEFAVKFLKALNPSADEDRIAMELFARGAPGTTDPALLYGNLDENIARWKAEEEKSLEERTLLFRGVEDMLRIVEYYKENPGVELPSQVFVLTNESEIPEHVKNNPRKTLIYWSEFWEQVEEIHKEKMQLPGKDVHISFPALSIKRLERPEDEEFIYEGEKNPDMFISNYEYPLWKRQLTLRGFDTVMINSNITAKNIDIECSGELKLYPNSSLVALSESSSVRAGSITQEGNLSVAKIQYNT